MVRDSELFDRSVNKKSNLINALDGIDKHFDEKKKESVTKLVAGLEKQGLGIASNEKKIEAIPTGIKSIDEYLIGGIGGFPRGRITELSGFESTGKSYFMYYQIAQVQRQGGLCALLDGEYSYDPDWGKQFGIDNNKLIVGHFDSAEQHYDQIFWLLAKKKPDLIVSDSVASLIPREYLSLKANTSKVAWEIAKVNKNKLRLLFNGSDEFPGIKLPESRTALVFINHLSEKVAEMYGDQYDTGGGRAVKFWAHLRLRLFPAGFGDVKDSMGNPTEQFVKVKVVKSRLGEPGKQCKIKLDWKGGIKDVPSEVIFHVAIEKNLILYKKGGAITFNWKNEEVKMRGKMNYVEYCENNESYKKFVMEESGGQ